MGVNAAKRKRVGQGLRKSKEMFQRLAVENAVIAEIGRIISSTPDINAVYERFAGRAKELIPFDRISVNIIDREKNVLTHTYVAGASIPGRQPGDLVSLDGTVAHAVSLMKQGLLIRADDGKETVTRYPALLSAFNCGLISMIVVPLVSNNNVIGVMHLASRKRNAYTDRDLRITESIGNQIAGAIANAMLLDDRKKAEEGLKRSEERFRQLSEATFEGVLIHDREKILDVNQRYANLFGYSASEIIGRSTDEVVKQVVAPDDRNTVLGNTYGESETSYEAWGVRKDGTTFPAEIVGKNTLFMGREARVVIVRDITQRREAEEAIRRSEREATKLALENAVMAEIGRIITSTPNIGEVYERFAEKARELIPFDRIAISLADQEKDILQVSYVAGVLVPGRQAGFAIPLEGTSAQAVIQTRKSLLIHAEDRNEIATRYPTLLPTFDVGLRSAILVPLISRDQAKGVLFFGSKRAHAYTDVDVRIGENIGNQVAGAIANTLLFEEHKRTAEALRENEEKFRDLYDNAPGGYHEFDMEGRITNINKTELEMMGYSFEEVIGKHVWKFSVDEDARREAILARLAGTNLPSQGIRRTYRRKDGTEFPILIHIRMLRDANGRIKGIRSAVQDITEQDKLEKERETLQEQLRESQKMEAIGQLAGGIAHDFNNMLTIIKGYTQLTLAEMNEQDPLRGNVDEIKKAADRAAGLTRQLLAFSRRQVMEMKIIDLNAALYNLEKMLRRVIGEDIDLVTLLAEDLGRVKTDPWQIEQVIMNLAVNARDAMPSGGKLVIETTNAELDEIYAHSHVGITPGRYVMIAVSDTGVGMTHEVKERIFEPFFTTKEKGRGTGLGLSTVYGIVRQSGGDVWVYSEPGQGTTFKIYLPRVDESLEELREKITAGETPQGTETILVVEDEEAVRKLAVRILKRQGYAVLDASSGEEALLIAGEHKGPIHLLVTDVVMPGMSGGTLAEQLTPIRPEMKVLYMSGYTDDAIVHHGMLDPGANYIQKPFTVEGLVGKVKEVLDK